MRNATLICAICVVCGSLLCFGSQSPVFESASIKLLTMGTPHGMLSGCHGSDSSYPDTMSMGLGMGIKVPPVAQCVLNGYSLQNAIAYQSGIRASQIVGGPGWVESDSFEIQAKAPNGPIPTVAALKQMLLRLLADRFQLKFHRETRQLSGYVLEVAKDGPKFKEATGNESPVGLTRMYRKIAGQNVSMAKFTDFLWDQIKTPVIDKTGLKGNYTFTIDVTNGDELKLREATSAGSVVSIFTSLEQIGLRLEAQKIPVEFLVIDSVERPAGN